MHYILRQLVDAVKNRMFAPESFSGSDLGYWVGNVRFKISNGRTALRRRIQCWLRFPALASRIAGFRRSVRYATKVLPRRY
jgi:hypothetical protein